MYYSTSLIKGYRDGHFCTKTFDTYSADRTAGIRHKKLKTIGADLGSAVKGFKESMRAGEAEDQTADAANNLSTRLAHPAALRQARTTRFT